MLRRWELAQGGNTPLHSAADRGQLEIAQLLLEHGANLGAKDEVCWPVTALWVLGPQPPSPPRPGPQPPSPSPSGPQPPSPSLSLPALARALRSLELLALMLACLCCVAVTRAQGDLTPLHHSALFGNLEFARLLLERGADVDAKSEVSWPITLLCCCWAELHGCSYTSRPLDMLTLMPRLPVLRGCDTRAVSRYGVGMRC